MSSVSDTRLKVARETCGRIGASNVEEQAEEWFSGPHLHLRGVARSCAQPR